MPAAMKKQKSNTHAPASAATASSPRPALPSWARTPLRYIIDIIPNRERDSRVSIPSSPCFVDLRRGGVGGRRRRALPPAASGPPSSSRSVASAAACARSGASEPRYQTQGTEDLLRCALLHVVNAGRNPGANSRGRQWSSSMYEPRRSRAGCRSRQQSTRTRRRRHHRHRPVAALVRSRSIARFAWGHRARPLLILPGNNIWRETW